MLGDHTRSFDIDFLLGMLMKRKYLALSVSLAVLSVFTWGSYLWPKSYEATSTVFIQRSSVMSPLLKGVGVSNSMDERLRTLSDSVLSRNVIERVIKKLDLDLEAKRPEKYENLIERIRKNIRINIKAPQGEADVFSISFTGPDPKKARDIVNTLVNEFISESLGFRKTDAYGAFEFIQTQLMEYKNKLEESDKAIREFRERNPNMVPQSEAGLLARIENFQNSRIDSEIRLKELLRKRENIQKQLSGEKELTVAVVTREGSPQARLDYLNNQLIMLMTKFTDKHPEILKVKGEIEELKKQIARAKNSVADSAGSETATLNPIYQQLREELSRTDAEIETLRARTGELSRQLNVAQGVVGRMPKEQEEWTKLQRDRNVYQNIYDDLMQKLENARVSKDLEITDKHETFKVVDPAVLPVFPVKPDRVKMILAGIVLGIASGIGAVYGIESLRRTFKDDHSIEEILKLPVLISIQSMKITGEDSIALQSREKKLLAAAGGYLLMIMLLLVKEILRRYAGINIVNF